LNIWRKKAVELKLLAFLFGERRAFVQIRRAEERGPLKVLINIENYTSSKKLFLTEIAHSCGPEVDRRRSPNLGFFVSLGWAAILEY
jgi:hypothetical protein